MAMQAGMATTKVLVLVGAGVAGSVLLKNSSISEFLADISKVFSKHLKEEEPSTERSDITNTLSAQVQRLTQELRQLAGSRTVTVINGSPSQNSHLTSLAMPVAIIGVAGYGYFWWKGWSFGDLMYVTKRNMANAVSSVSKQLEQVSTTLSATKRHLSSRLDFLTKTLDDNVTVQGVIKDQVIEVRGEVVRVGDEIETVQRIVEGLEVKLDEVQCKQDFTNKGIILLCQFVQGLERVQRPELLQFSVVGREHTHSEYEYAYIHGCHALFRLLETNPDVLINWEAAQEAHESPRGEPEEEPEEEPTHQQVEHEESEEEEFIIRGGKPMSLNRSASTSSA